MNSAKLAPKSVIIGKLAENSVGPGNIGNGAVTTAKLAANSVIASTIKNSVITTNKLNNEAVNTSQARQRHRYDPEAAKNRYRPPSRQRIVTSAAGQRS